MPSFDIVSLLGFKPATHLCEKCCGLIRLECPNFERVSACPICGVKYLATNEFTLPELPFYLDEVGCSAEVQNLVEHSRQLAQQAYFLRTQASHYPPLRSLLGALLHAQRFVHFTTFGISHLMIGALKVVAQRAQVRGIAANVRDDTRSELIDFGREAPQLAVQVYPEGVAHDEIPHQKVIVIDGLLAFKGSANMTSAGWRKAESDLDIIEVVTDLEEVISLHNRYFAKLWAKHSSVGESIPMTRVIEF